MYDDLLPAPPDLIQVVENDQFTIILTGDHALVHCHVTDSVCYNGALPSDFTRDDFLELFAENNA